MSVAASSANSERDERVFIAAFGMMDSDQDGEAAAAFVRARTILRRHGGRFRRILERSHEAERLNEELGQQNAQLLRENAALRARDSRAASPSPVNARRSGAMPAIPEFRHWDIWLVGVIAVSEYCGLLDLTAALVLTAAIFVSAAFAKWFSPLRFFFGIVAAIAALAVIGLNKSASAEASAPAVADVPFIAVPAETGRAGTDAAPPLRPSADAAPPHQTFADALPHWTSAPPRSARKGAPGTRCSPSHAQHILNCSRSPHGDRFLFQTTSGH